mgnify:CR=1 FL=1
MSSLERTLSIIKPDAVERNLTENIKQYFVNNKLRIVKEKKIQVTKDEAAEFYKVHQTKPFYDRLCNYLSSGPFTVIILEGDNAIKENRRIMGATDPIKAEDGTIRKKYGISIDKNSIAENTPAGTIIGKLRVDYNEELIGEYELLALDNVEKVNIFTRLIKSLNYFCLCTIYFF